MKLLNRRGQLFLIEVIIALSVLVVLIAALFTVHSFSPPPNDALLIQNGEAAIDALVENGLMDEYLLDANYSKYVLGESILDPINQTKVDILNSISGLVPAVSNFKAYTERYNETTNTWDLIDLVNFEASLPTGSSVTLVEYYTPGINGVFAEFTFKLYIWNEVTS